MKQATRKELEQMMIDELDKIEGCQGVKSITIGNLNEPGYPNWEMTHVNYGDADKYHCNSALPGIVKRLQAEYERIDDNT